MRFRNTIAFSTAFAVLAAVGVAKADVSPAVTSKADSYRPGDYLLLDLKTAVLSPKPLGPPAAFEHVQIEARSDAKNAIDAAADKPVTPAQKAVPVAKPRSAEARTQPPARARVARKHTNPLDANAADTRVQVWPCRTGGICNWQR